MWKCLKMAKHHWGWKNIIKIWRVLVNIRRWTQIMCTYLCICVKINKLRCYNSHLEFISLFSRVCVYLHQCIKECDFSILFLFVQVIIRFYQILQWKEKSKINYIFYVVHRGILQNWVWYKRWLAQRVFAQGYSRYEL